MSKNLDLHSFQEDAAALGKLQKAHVTEVQVIPPIKIGSSINNNQMTFQLCHITKDRLCCEINFAVH